MALLTVLGTVGQALGDDRRLGNTMKRRTHALFRQGLMRDDWLPRMSEKYSRPLIDAFAADLAQQRGLAIVFALRAN